MGCLPESSPVRTYSQGEVLNCLTCTLRNIRWSARMKICMSDPAGFVQLLTLIAEFW